MTRDEILDALCEMLPGQFDYVVAKLAVPPQFLSGALAAQATRAGEVVRWLEAQPRVSELRVILRSAVAVSSAAGEIPIARQSGGAPPPPTERIPPGLEGQDEFKRLMHQLLKMQADRHGLQYSPGSFGAGQVGIDGFALDGTPELRGLTVFQFIWSPGESLNSTKIGGNKSPVGGGQIVHWIVIGTWASELLPSGFRPACGAELHQWGNGHIGVLLRQCPALLARYYPQEARAYVPGYDGADFGAFVARYREKVALVHSRLKTIGIPPEARRRESLVELPLDKLFIPLRLVPQKRGAAPVDLAPILTAGGSAVLLADPGMGKSTLLSFLALVFAGGARVEGFFCSPRALPLHISLRDFVRRQKERPGLSFLEHLEIEARERHSLPGAHRVLFEAALRMGEAVVLLDGLDEVGNESARHALATAIRMFHAEYGGCRFWVTSRIYGYTENVRLSASFPHYRIDRLDDTQIDDFVRRWYAHQLLATSEDAAEQAASLSAAVRRTPSVRRLAGNPLLLTLMAFIHHGLRKLPRDRGELYEKCVEMLLKTWQEAKRKDGEAPRAIDGLTLNVPTQKDYLAHLAFFVQQKNEDGNDEEARGLVSRREAIEALTERHLARARRGRAMNGVEAREEMTHFLDYICDETGLLVDRGNDLLSFIHLSFQEYLAAWVFVCDDEMPHGPDFFVKYVGNPAWQEVLLLRLYIVLLGGGGGVKNFDTIVGTVLRSLERKTAPESWLTLVRAIRDDLELSEIDRREIVARAVRFWLEAPTFEGTWFTALDEVRLFGDRAREMLPSVLSQARLDARKPSDVVALLHLETRFFRFPEGAADALFRRMDLPEMLPDLVAFMDVPEIRALLIEKATVTHWTRGFRALDGPEVYRMTLRLTATAAAEAATALLWEKILTDFRSRATWARPRRADDDAAFLVRPGAVSHQTPFSSAVLPHTALRALQASQAVTFAKDFAVDFDVLPDAALRTAVKGMSMAPDDPPGVEEHLVDYGEDTKVMSLLELTGYPSPLLSTQALPEASLLCPSLAQSRRGELAAADVWTELADWTASTIAAQLDRFPAAAPVERQLAPRLAASFGRSFVRSIGRSLVRDYVSDFGGFTSLTNMFGGDFGCSFVRSVGLVVGRSVGRSVDSSAGPSFVRSAGRSFVRDFGHFFAPLAGRFFVHDSGVDTAKPEWEVVWGRAMEDEGDQIRLLADNVVWTVALSGGGRTDVDAPRTITAPDLALANPLAFPLLLHDLWSAAATHVFVACFRRANLPNIQGLQLESALEAQLSRNPVDVYATAFAWQEHCKGVGDISGVTGALFLAHAAYASLMTGLECKPHVSPDLEDPRIRVSLLLHELCNFRDVETTFRKLEAEIASAGPELLSMLQTAGLVTPSADVPEASVPSARIKATSEPEPKPEPSTLFTWLHLSDLHFGRHDAHQRWDQQLVLAELSRDIAQHKAHDIPTPRAILVTGDVSYGGASDQYAGATAWLEALALVLGLTSDCIFVVPGNHDVDRSVDRANRNVARLLRDLRGGDELLDDVLAHPDDKALLTSRLGAYISFASAFPSLRSPDPLFWSHAFTAGLLPIRFIGLSTALLAADDIDHGKLRLGTTSLSATLTGADRAGELVVVLTHHPIRDGWLADQSDADQWIQGHAHVHIFGHVQEADTEFAGSGTAAGLIRVAAGAVHSGTLSVPASYGYSISAVIVDADGSLRLRIWPRRWSDQHKCFRIDLDNTSGGQSYAEHRLTALRIRARP
jgi:hypothetical protein